MTDLIAELAEVVRQLDRWWYAPKLAHDFLRTHHAEIEAMARDSERWRYLRENFREAVFDDSKDRACWPDDHEPQCLDAAIDAAMRDSAREDDNE